MFIFVGNCGGGRGDGGCMDDEDDDIVEIGCSLGWSIFFFSSWEIILFVCELGDNILESIFGVIFCGFGEVFWIDDISWGVVFVIFVGIIIWGGSGELEIVVGVEEELIASLWENPVFCLRKGGFGGKIADCFSGWTIGGGIWG